MTNSTSYHLTPFLFVNSSKRHKVASFEFKLLTFGSSYLGKYFVSAEGSTTPLKLVVRSLKNGGKQKVNSAYSTCLLTVLNLRATSLKSVTIYKLDE